MLRLRKPKSGRLAVLTALVAALGVMSWAASARADIVTIDPTGGAGANPATVLDATSFAFAPGNTIAVGGAPLDATSIGKVVPIYYQAIVSGINTASGGNGNSAAIDSNSGNITVNPAGVNTGNQFVITAQFNEQISSFQAVGTQTTVGFTPALGTGTNEFHIYAQTANDANSANLNKGSVGYPPSGTPPPGSVPIISGFWTTQNFTGSFSANTDSFTSPVPLNQHTGGSGTYGGINQPSPATQTIVGTGNTGGLIGIPTTTDPNYILSPPNLFSITLNFVSVSTATPFNGVDPTTLFFNGYVPVIGAVNGVSGTDFLFQTQAVANFNTVPEPGTVSMALAGIGMVSLAALRARRHQSKPSAA